MRLNYEEDNRGLTAQNSQYSHDRIGGKGKTVRIGRFEKTAPKREAIRIPISILARKA